MLVSNSRRAPRLVVILDAQLDAAAERPRDAPDEDRVDEVSEMEMSGG